MSHEPIVIDFPPHVADEGQYTQTGTKFAYLPTLRRAPITGSAEQIEVIKDIRRCGFKIIVHPDGAVELRRE